MALQRWAWQTGSANNDSVYAAAMWSNGAFILASETEGAGGDNPFTWIATKFDVNGTILWESKLAHKDDDAFWWHLDDVVVEENGSVVLAGGGSTSPAVVKIDPSGELEWQKEGCEQKPRGLVIMENGAIIVGGTGNATDSDNGDFTACKLESNGTTVSTWEGGTQAYDTCDTTVLSDNDSVVLAGHTFGDWAESEDSTLGGRDFAAVKLDKDMTGTIWKWQGGTDDDDVFLGGGMGDNGSVILVGSSYGDWAGTNKGGEDFIAVKLDTDGNVLWKWQDGTDEEDRLTGAVTVDQGTVFLSGYTKGLWGESHAGGYDFAGILLNLSDGTRLWRWQNGTSENDIALGVTGGYDGLVVLAGLTNGSWIESNLGGNDSFAVMLDMKRAVLETPAPATIEIMPSTSYTPPSPQLDTSSFSTKEPQYHVTFFPTSSDPDFAMKSEPSSNYTWIVIITAVSVVAVIALIAFGAIMLTRRRRKARVEKIGAIQAISPSNLDSKDPEAGRRLIDLSSWNWRTAIRSSRSLANQQRATSATSLPLPASGSETRMNSKDLNRTLVIVEKHTGSSPNQTKAMKPSPIGTAEEEKMSEETELSYSDFSYDANLVNPTSGYSPENNEGRDPSQVPPKRSHRSVTSVASDGAGGADAVQDAAHILADSCPLPVVSEAVTMVSTLAKLIGNSPGNAAGRQGKLRRCRSILKMLGRAAEVLGKGIGKTTAAESILLEDVHDAVDHLVELIKTYQSKNQLAQVITSSLFQRRQEEAEAVIDSAISRLQVSLHMRIGHKINVTGNELDERIVSESKFSDISPEEDRHLRRKRQLDQIEIPEDQITVTDELLGRGGFGAVYIADFNGQNAAAKVKKELLQVQEG